MSGVGRVVAAASGARLQVDAGGPGGAPVVSFGGGRAPLAAQGRAAGLRVHRRGRTPH